MKKRIYITSFLLTLLAIYAVTATAAAAFSGYSVETVASQSSYSIGLEKKRGIIYDRDLEPLTDSEKVTMAVAFPTEKVFRTLKFNAAEEYDKDELQRQALPFSLEVSHILECEGISYYETTRRYSGICAHLLGHLEAGNVGVSGMEALFDGRLRTNKEITFTYTGDALGKVIPEEDSELHTEEVNSGVALTIDKNIQLMAEEAAEVLDKGAVVVMDIASSDILAMVSRPDFDPNLVENYLDDGDSPLLDRCLEAYTPGSVFKLVVSAVALEKGLDPKEEFPCVGSIMADGMAVSCYGGKAHGEMNLHTALQNSCNCYFINLASKLNVQDIYAMALNLGLGTGTELTAGFEGKPGYIGSIPELKNPRALANFAIGQGDILVTPVQMAAMIGAIANNGVYSIPNILEGFVDEDGNILEGGHHGQVQVMSPGTAQKLRTYMESVVKFGTGRSAHSEDYSAGAKTGTAQTGVFEDGNEKLNYWFCGYAGRTEVPEYVIIVLREGASDGENVTGEVFRRIAEGMM